MLFMKEFCIHLVEFEVWWPQSLFRSSGIPSNSV
jgi:hypothetical protein